MIVLDTDIFWLYVKNNPRVVARADRASEPFSITIITQIEVLRGRITELLTAADSDQLRIAQRRWDESVTILSVQTIVRFNEPSLNEFERLRANKSLRKIGRADLCIASIALAHSATLVTRNLKHFRQVPGLRVENWAD